MYPKYQNMSSPYPNYQSMYRILKIVRSTLQLCILKDLPQWFCDGHSGSVTATVRYMHLCIHMHTSYEATSLYVTSSLTLLTDIFLMV
jgi:hypothetical protein